MGVANAIEIEYSARVHMRVKFLNMENTMVTEHHCAGFDCTIQWGAGLSYEIAWHAIGFDRMRRDDVAMRCFVIVILHIGNHTFQRSFHFARQQIVMLIAVDWLMRITRKLYND